MFVVGGWLPDRPALRNFPSATPSDPTLMLGPIRTGYGAETKNKNTKSGPCGFGGMPDQIAAVLEAVASPPAMAWGLGRGS
jgi:hypothetical protein